MPGSDRSLPSGQSVAYLRNRANRLRELARQFPKDISDTMLELAAELDTRADAIELPIKPDAADP